MKRNIIKQILKRLRVVAAVTILLIVMLVTVTVVQDRDKPIPKKRVQLVLIDKSLSNSATNLVLISDDAVCKKVASAMEIEENTKNKDVYYKDKILVVSKENQEMKKTADRLGYSIVQVN